jgi:tetratricopeptide (TPR) repeat protein
MSFDTQAFYDELDRHFAAFDNAATEKFLLEALDNVENSVYLEGNCACCGDGDCNDKGEKELTPAEKDWIVSRSQGMIAILNELACFYRGVSRFDESMDAFARLKKEMEDCELTGTDNYALVTLNLAGAYRLMGKFDEALAAFDEAGSILAANGKNDPYSLSSLYNNKGLVYQDKRDYARAAEHFEKALELMPRTPENRAEVATSMNNLAMAAWNCGDKEKAVKVLDESLAIFKDLDGGMNPHYAGALNTRAIFAYNGGDYAGAAALFEQAVEKTKLIFGENREYAIGCRNCSAAWDKAGDAAKAADYAAKAAEAEKKLG